MSHTTSEQDDSDSSKKLKRWSREVIVGGMTDALRDLVRVGTLAVLGAAASITVGLVTFLRSEDVPAWALPVATAVGVIVGIVVLRASQRGLQAARKDIARADERTRAAEAELDRQRARTISLEEDARERLQAKLYEEHVAQILETFQKVVAKGIPGVSLDTFIQRGILEPARDMLKRDPGNDIRLSVLVEDQGVYRMRYGVGHRLESVRRFRLAVEDSMAQKAVERNEPIVWQDLTMEPDYRPHPRSTRGREIRGMIAQPIHVGETTVGVFNVVASCPNSFSEADINYAKIIGCIISAAMSVMNDREGLRRSA